MTDQPDTTFVNFRDVSNLLRAGGFGLRRNMLFRSGLSAQPDASQLKSVLGPGSTLVIDLRSPNERRRAPSLQHIQPGGDIFYFASEIEEEAPHFFFPDDRINESTIEAYYSARYIEMATREDFERLYARCFELLCRPTERVLIHCSAGKDRTGILIALLLSALEVPAALVEMDYLASNGAKGLEAGIHAAMSRMASTIPAQDRGAIARTLAQTRPHYLNGALGAIRQKHGSFNAFFDWLGLDQDARVRMKTRFYEQPDV